MVTITDRKSLEKWLKGREPQVAAVIAVRAALRVLPLISENWRGGEANEKNTALILPVLRAAFVSRVAPLAPTRETKMWSAGDAAEAAEAAIAHRAAAMAGAAQVIIAVYLGARAAARGGAANDENAADAADAADAAAGAVLAADDEFWKAVSEDCTVLGDGKEVAGVLTGALWLGAGSPEAEPPAEIARAWQRLQDYFNLDGSTWGFWRDWYQKVLDGQYQRPELLLDIALLPNEVWEAGPEVVAERIAGLQAKYLSAATPLAERLEVDRATAQIFAVHVPINRQQLYATGLQRMKDAFEDAKANNEVGAGSQEARLIKRALYDHANDPQYVHDNLVQARKLIQERIASDFLPESGTASSLVNTSLTFETDIRAWHPQVEEAVIARGRIKLAEIDPRDLIVVADLPSPVLVLLKGDLATETREDIAEVTDVTPLAGGKVPERAIEVLYRLASRLVRIYKILGDEAIFAGKVGAAMAALAAAIRYFASLFAI